MTESMCKDAESNLTVMILQEVFDREHDLSGNLTSIAPSNGVPDRADDGPLDA